MKHQIFGLLIASVLVLVVGCQNATSGGGSSSSLPKTIGFSQVNSTDSDWRDAQTASIKAAITGQGTNLLFDGGDGTLAPQLTALDSFITKKVDVIVVVPSVETGWDAELAKAKAAGIPVVVVDRAVTVSDSSLYRTYLTEDFVNEGKQAAAAVAGKLTSGGTVLELIGITNNGPSDGRESGFDTELTTNHSGFTIVHSVTDCNWLRATAKSYVIDHYTASPLPAAIFAQNDEMGLGAIDAIKELGKTPGTDVIVVSCDGEKAALQAVKDGTLYYCFECTPLQGPTVIDLCNQIYAGRTVASKGYMTERGYYKADVTDALIAARTY